MKKSQALPQPTAHVQSLDRFGATSGKSCHRNVKTEAGTSILDVPNDLPTRIADPQNTVAETTLRVKDAGQKALPPRVGRRPRPRNQVANFVDGLAAVGPNAVDLPAVRERLLKQELSRRYLEVSEVVSCARESFGVRECQPELVHFVLPAPATRVGIRSQPAIPADHAAKVPLPVVIVHDRRRGEGAHPHQLVVGRQIRALSVSAHATGDELPTAFGQEPVVGTGDQTPAVAQANAIRRLDDLPVAEDSCVDVPPIPAATDRAVNHVTDAQPAEGATGSVAH
jgi:hypothetical protein